jgi:hypothetical protein
MRRKTKSHGQRLVLAVIVALAVLLLLLRLFAFVHGHGPRRVGAAGQGARDGIGKVYAATTEIPFTGAASET